jgi:hypothetical protein
MHEGFREIVYECSPVACESVCRLSRWVCFHECELYVIIMYVFVYESACMYHRGGMDSMWQGSSQAGQPFDDVNYTPCIDLSDSFVSTQ